MARKSDRSETALWRYMDEWAQGHYKFSLSQGQWAQLLGLSDSTISDWKLGKVVPERHHLRLVSDETGLSYRKLNELADEIADAKRAARLTPERVAGAAEQAADLMDGPKRPPAKKPKTGTEDS